MGVKELKLTKDLMVRSGPEHFDMDTWFRGRIGSRDISRIYANELENLNECGTAACFFGFARLAVIEQGEEYWINSVNEPQEVADWLGVPKPVAFADNWKQYHPRDIDPDDEDKPDLEFLADRWINHVWVADGSIPSIRRAEWHTILDYIDWKISQGEPA